jgi:hypothetical protein
MTKNEENAMEDMMGKAVGASLLMVVRLLIDAGMTPTDSMRLATFFVIEEALGREVIREIGLPRNTASRWRREIAAAAKTERAQELVLDEAYELQALNGLLPLIGLRDLRMVRAGDDDV